MKKQILLVFVILVILTACSKKMDMKDVEKEPNFSGIVDEVNEESIFS